jgi:protease-4
MALDADLIVDRRRLRRKLSFWRWTGVAALIVAVLALGGYGASRTGLVPGAQAQHVARVTVSGFITYDRPLIRALDRVAEDGAVRAVVLQIDSPGGSTTGSEALYAAIRRVAARKPVVAVVGVLGASGAYVAALGADHVVAGETSLVGSIGVVVQWAEVHQLLRRAGIEFQQVRTSPLKASPNPFEPTSPEARAALQAVVGDSYRWFSELVRERRRIEGEALTQVADGRVFTGRQSLELRLVDQIGDERAAIAWLERERAVPARLPVRDVRPDRDRLPGFFNWAIAGLAEQLGLQALLPLLGEGEARLDGLVSLWHPGLRIER